MTIFFPWRREKTNELRKYALGQRGDTFYISTKPADPVRRSDICIIAECSYRADRVVNQAPKPKSKEPEYTLSYFWVTYRPDVHPSQIRIKCQAYTVSLYENTIFLKAEVRNHVKVYAAVHALWLQVREAVLPRCPRIGIQRPTAKIFARGRSGITNVPTGFMTRSIPALNPQHCMFLARAFLDPRIMRKVRNDPLISEVRLRVRMGEMSPPNDHLNPQLLFRPVYINQLRLEAGKESVLRWAASMGVTLAILHWSCGLDGEGVNFVIGSSQKASPRLWATDFGGCKHMKPEGWKSRQGLGAIMNNPTWPRPVFAPSFTPDGDPNDAIGIKEAWNNFINAYKQVGRIILFRQNRRAEIENPRRFVDKLEAAWKRRQGGSDVESLSGSSTS